MNRRQTFKVLAAASAVVGVLSAQGTAPIQLHVDLEVDPAKEKEMLSTYANVFRPAISKQPGFVEVKLLKLRSALAGQAPAGATHRLIISFQTEDQRLKWVATDVHQKVWPQMEKTLKSTKYSVILYDPI